MAIYLRLVDANGNQHGWKECYSRGELSTHENYVRIANYFKHSGVEYKFSYLTYRKAGVAYPVKIQIVRKRKYKNGNITKIVKYEKIIN